MSLPTQYAKNVTDVIASGGKRADHLAKATPQGEQSSGAFDVYNHTVDGLAQKMTEAVNDPSTALLGDPEQQARVDAAMMPGEWESSSLDDSIQAMKIQQEGLKKQVDAIANAKGGMATVGATFELLTGVEQMISTAMSVLPFPAFPAVRVSDIDIGLPHAHMHPPNLTPPNPVPVPLPSTGPVIPIPFLSGAGKTLINALPAARCGDMGLGVWCGGYFPMYEIFLGSSSVWIEGARAARLAVDVTWHCIFSVPKPSDPPLGPMVGSTITASPNVLVGGIPMPSLLGLAMGGAVKGLVAGLGKLVKKLKAGKVARELGESPGFSRAARESSDGEWIDGFFVGKDSIDYGANYIKASKLIDQLEDKMIIIIVDRTDEFAETVREQLRRIACSKTGREVLEDIQFSGRKVVIEHLDDAPPGKPSGAHADYHSWGLKEPGGTDTTVRYDPNSGTPGSPPDVTLIHELGHARSAANGTCKLDNTEGMSDAMKHRWTDWEEVEVIDGVDNAYRAERGLPLRMGHRHMPRVLFRR